MSGKFVPWFSDELEIVFGGATAVCAVLSLLIPGMLQLFYGTATFFSFILSARLPRMVRSANWYLENG